MLNRFKCLACGNCCRRIVVNQNGITVGLCLLPDEIKVFKSFPGSVMPYIGLKKIDSSEIEIVNYQMIIEPCPLLDLTENRCKKYKKRPNICREYPFTPSLNGVSFENQCSFMKSKYKNVEYGKTKIEAGMVQKKAMAKMSKRYHDIGNRLMADKDLRLMIRDCKKDEWIGKFEDFCKP